jgi:dolichol-phosphate mannosyltransferase
MAAMTSRLVSIIIACYKDEGSVREFHRRLTEVLPPVAPNYEIIYVNDASPDNAESVLREIAARDRHLVIVNHTRNFGSQNAFLSGMRIARGDAVVLMDGDLQDPPSLIPGMIEKWEEGFQIVYGNRVKRKESLGRQIAYKMFYRFFRKMAPFSIPVDAGDFGLIDRRVVEVLLGEFPENLVFLRGLRAYTGFKSTGVEYIRDARFDGVSTNSVIGNLRWAKLAIFSFSKKPLEYIAVIAIISVLLTMLGALYYLYLYFHKGAPPGWTTLILVIMMISSVQLVCFAVLSEYMAHIYDEVKHRPRYIVRDIVDNRLPAPGPGGESATGRNDGPQEGQKA